MIQYFYTFVKCKTLNPMKKSVFYVLFSCALYIFSSCAGTKEVSVPCIEKGRSDAQFFRASGSAKSRDMASAKDKALISTKQILASLIGSSIKSVTDNYINQAASGSSSTSQKIESITRETVNQQLKGLVIACEKTQKNKDGNYESFVAIEMPKSKIISSIIDRIQQDPELSSEFNKNKFQEIAEKEFIKK